jgi:broad specificity phosphatase PhoE
MFRRKRKPSQQHPPGARRPLTIFFVRHGQAEDPQTDVAYDPDLTRLGRKQAARVARRLSNEHFDHIYLSDLSRAYRTGERILKFHPDVPVTVTRTLREIAHDHFIPDSHNKSGSEPAILKERNRIDEFADHLCRSHEFGSRILVVAHGNLIRVLLPVLAGYNPQASVMIELENTSVTILETWPSKRSILRLANCVSHLRRSEISL